MTLTGCASVPAADSRRYVVAEQSGARIVEMVREDLRPTKLLTRKAIENGITVDMAIGGSTNAIIHFLGFRRTVGNGSSHGPVRRDFSPHAVSRQCARPSGKYLMENLFYAGGLPALMKEIESLLHLDAMTATGKTMGENILQQSVQP